MKNENNKPLWQPTEIQVNSSNFFKYMTFLKEKFQLNLKDYDELYYWSVSEIETFWKSIWDYSEIIHSKTYTKILDKRIMPGAKWFINSKLNFAENLLRYSDDKIAIISIREDKPAIKITYKQLNDLVSKCAQGLKQLGVKKEDRVAGLVTNYPESLIAMLAATSIGALWSSCSPDFGIQGVYDRFGQIKPKVLFAVEEYLYNGQKINCKEKIEQIVERINEIEHVVFIPKFNNFTDILGNNKDDLDDSKYIKFNKLISNNSEELEFNQLPFDHPVYVMYSSGTTGLPKCMVHGAGGILLQHFKEHYLHTNLKREDTLFYFTTCGWMMWNWLVSALQIGCSIVLYDGNPAYPDSSKLWSLIDEHNISVFGTSPKYLTHCKNSGVRPIKEFNTDSLKTILSTGSPLTSDNYDWVYTNVKNNLMLSSISGGTDIISCFMLGNPTLPVYKEEIQCRGLGMRVKAFDENGEEVIDRQGELVCTEPFPSMPVYFWDDEDGVKYFNSYFNKFPNVWTHGDFIKITNRGTVIVYGRSDATLNPGGVRIGTAEIYRVVEAIDEVAESLVVGKEINGDVKVILFVVLKEEIELSDSLIKKIKKKIKELASPRHVPSIIYRVKEIPHTISGKKVEIAVSKIINGKEVENKDALANPNSLKEYYRYR